MTRGRRHHAVAGVAAGLLVMATLVVAHPGCYDDEALQQDTPLVFCPVEDEGVCCTLEEEQDAILLYSTYAQVIQDAAENNADAEACGEAWKEVSCGRCGSYAGHLYARLGNELTLDDGMNMKKAFCEEMVSNCAGLIDFGSMTYDGLSYCEKHTEDDDEVWSHPIDPAEKATFSSSGLTSAFPNLDDDNLPAELISMKMTPDGSHWWLVGQKGEIREVSADDPTDSTLILDLWSGFDLRYEYEEGLLDVAFDPDYSNNKYFYCSYTIETYDDEDEEYKYYNRLARFTHSSSVEATEISLTIILTSEPKATSIHSAGWVDFKPTTRDLYWAIGDGGPQEDPNGTGSDLTNILASIVRVSVPSSGSGFNLSPSGNLQGSICASGWRNPFRCGFDKVSPYSLYCGDVGHNHVEEINKVECGNDYGWSRFEGSRCQEEQNDRFGDENCATGLSRDGITFPIFQYCHRSYPDDPDDVAYLTGGVDICGARTIEGEAAIGGYPYRGKRFEEVLSGALIFGDAQMRNIHYLTENSDGTWDSGTIVGNGDASVISFAEDNDGEQYIITRDRKPYQLPCGLFCADPEQTDEGETETCLDLGDTTQDVPSYTSEGCWADLDTKARALYLDEPECPKGQRLMSPEICARYCSTVPGATYFGLEFSYECFCGNDASTTTGFKKNDALNLEDDCSMLCSDNSGDFCGGMSAIEVFAFGDVTPPSPTPVPDFPIGNGGAGYENVDCFVDNKNDRVLSITAQKTPNEDMTNQVCAALCEGKGSYFGTQFGYECFCSDDTKDVYDRLGTDGADCSYACSGDADQTCGGMGAIQVYQYTETAPTPVTTTPSPVATGDYTSLGCFVDDKTRTLSIMAQKDVNDFMTVQACAEICSEYESTYFGLQYSYQCFCSDDTKDVYDRLGSDGADCGMACSGEPTQTCGGAYANQVYQLTDAPPPTPVVATPSPVTPPTTGDYTSLGCFADDRTTRVLSNWAQKDKNDFMTIEACADICSEYESTYFGVQYSYQCFCSAGDDTPSTVGASTSCNMPCSGNADQTCGGIDAFSAYQLGGDGPAPTPPPVPSSGGGFSAVGCFADFREPRVMSIYFPEDLKTTNDYMTAQYCADLCLDEGSEFFGTQYGYQCFCSAAADTPLNLVTDGASCDVACSGDASETCGGGYALSLYEFDA